MGKDERLNTSSEIKRTFPRVKEGMKNAGPTIFTENGMSYYDNSEAHTLIVGSTGTGKSNTHAGSMGNIENISKANENLIMIDPKGEGIGKFGNELMTKGYEVKYIDFDNPGKSPTSWNPLEYIRRLYTSPSREDNDFAAAMLNEFARAIYPNNKNADPFWTDSAAEFFTGCVYLLLENADTAEINLNSIDFIMQNAETKIGAGTYMKECYKILDDSSMAKRYLATYVNAPNDTRMSIFSVAKNGIAKFAQSKGLMNMLNNDNLNIYELDVDKPFALFIVKPDENTTYDALCGFLVTQLTQHFIKLARKRYNGKLPVKLHVILEELGSLGASITNLPNLMVASRSRNIRLCLVLQSYSQLKDIYGKSQSETILSSVGVTIAFSTNNWDTLEEWSHKCGNRTIYENGSRYTEPILTPNQIAAMPVATALILIRGRMKWVCKFPILKREVQKLNFPVTERNEDIKTFDMKKVVDKYKELKRAELFETNSSKSPFSTQSSDEDTKSISFEEIMKHLHNDSEKSTEIILNEVDDDDVSDDKINNMLSDIEKEISNMPDFAEWITNDNEEE